MKVINLLPSLPIQFPAKKSFILLSEGALLVMIFPSINALQYNHLFFSPTPSLAFLLYLFFPPSFLVS